MEKMCKNCAWFCHADGKCYWNAIVEELAEPVSPDGICRFWAFDGLSDQEREEYAMALMTMEEVM